MSVDTDVLVIGSGPAGVSAAHPLVAGGVRTWMIDGGEVPSSPVPDGEVLHLRANDREQSRWLVGDDAHALRNVASSSPKFRAPTLAYVFRDYALRNGLVAENFSLTGSLATGGMSNAWGCGVTRFSERDWGGLALDAREIEDAHEAVVRRIGVSGAADDDVASFFGLDALAQPPIPLDALHQTLLGRYEVSRPALHAAGFRLGRARLAVLAQDASPERRACDGRGLCLWGCPRGSMYSSSFDLAALRRYPNFAHHPGRIVERLERDADGSWRASIRRRDGTREAIVARSVVLAAGTIASTAIAMRSLPGFIAAPLAHLPTAAFVLCLPRYVGADARPGPGTAQLAFTLDGDEPQETCGYTFATHGLPVSEFIRYAPLSIVASAALFRALLPSCIVANCFLPSRFVRSRMEMRDDVVRVIGEHVPALGGHADGVRRRLAASFRRAGAWMLPGSFTQGAVGADIHYACTMPMRTTPAPGQTDVDGALAGLPGVYVVDGAALPALPAKSHTLGVMVNAHRIGMRLVRRMRLVA